MLPMGPQVTDLSAGCSMEGSVAGSMIHESAGPNLKSGKGLILAAATAEASTMPGLACRARLQLKITSPCNSPRKGKGPATMQAEVPREPTATVPNARLQTHRVVPSPVGSDANFSGKDISAITQMLQTLVQRMDVIKRKEKNRNKLRTRKPMNRKRERRL